MTRLKKNVPTIGTAASTVGVMVTGTTKATMLVQACSANHSGSYGLNSFERRMLPSSPHVQRRRLY